MFMVKKVILIFALVSIFIAATFCDEKNSNSLMQSAHNNMDKEKSNAVDHEADKMVHSPMTSSAPTEEDAVEPISQEHSTTNNTKSKEDSVNHSQTIKILKFPYFLFLVLYFFNK